MEFTEFSLGEIKSLCSNIEYKLHSYFLHYNAAFISNKNPFNDCRD